MKRLVVLSIAALALLVPSAALAGGVVLKVQRGTHLIAVTRSNTKVALVHTSAASRLHVGQRVAMSARTLRNGTLAASKVRVLGRAHTVHFRGLMLAKDKGHIVVSAGGAVVTVNKGANDEAPKPGTTVDVTATVGPDDQLDDDNVTTVSADHPGGSIEGKLTIGTTSITIVSEHMALAINLPSGFDLSKFQNGDEVLAVFAQQADGTLLLTSLSGDENAQQADEQNDGDGDHSGSGSGGDNGGAGGSGGGDNGGSGGNDGGDG